MDWTVILQLQHTTRSECRRYAIPGLLRPARIFVTADDPRAQSFAVDLYAKLDGELKRLGGGSISCGGAKADGCMAALEPACHHVLVPIVDVPPMTPNLMALCANWSTIAGHSHATILAALGPNIPTSAVSAALPPNIAHLQVPSWSGSIDRLAGLVLRAALHQLRPSVFLSYRRADASQLADKLFDALNRRAFRVYLDRFVSTPGRPFPLELAEEMAACDVLLLIESAGIRSSPWTMWEIAFAQLYRIGVIALHLRSSPSFSYVDRRFAAVARPSDSDVENLADKVQRAHAIAALRRRAFYEGIVVGAARARNRDVDRGLNGVLRIVSGAGAARKFHGAILTVGKPGTPRDLRQLSEGAISFAAPTGATILLAGQHNHLDSPSRQDLDWARGPAGIDLVGRFDTYWASRSLP